MAMKYERLTTPLVREDGELRAASWDEALDRAAAGFRGAREAHPIYFHHLLMAVNDRLQVMVVGPRRTRSAQWADFWLWLDVGTDIPLANAVAREILEASLADLEFVERAATGFDAFRESI